MPDETNTASPHACAYRVRTSRMHPVLDVLGDPWNLSILRDVGTGITRFDALVERLGISRPALSKRLDALTDVGCLHKKAYCPHPPRYEYSLSDMGLAVGPILLLLRQWNHAWLSGYGMPDVQCKGCGHELTIDVICAHCRERLDPRQVKPLFFAPVPDTLPLMPAYRRTRHQLVSRGRARSPDEIPAEDWLQDRWSALIVGGCMMGLQRYADFLAVLEIAPNILAGRLDVLQQAALLARRQDGSFCLTEKGWALYPAIMAMRAWGERWLQGEAAMEKEWGLLHMPCGEWLKLDYVCHSCGATAAFSA